MTQNILFHIYFPTCVATRKCFLVELMKQVKFLYPLYLREENEELKLNGQIIWGETKMII